MVRDKAQKRPRQKVIVAIVGTVAVLLALRLLADDDDEASTTAAGSGPSVPSFQPAHETKPVPAPEQPKPSQAAPAEAIATDSTGHQTWAGGAGEIVYEAPGGRPRVISPTGGGGPTDIAVDSHGNVHFAWFDATERSIQYARLEPGAHDEDIVRTVVAQASAVKSVNLKIDRGVTTIEYTGPNGVRHSTARP